MLLVLNQCCIIISIIIIIILFSVSQYPITGSGDSIPPQVPMIFLCFFTQASNSQVVFCPIVSNLVSRFPCNISLSRHLLILYISLSNHILPVIQNGFRWFLFGMVLLYTNTEGFQPRQTHSFYSDSSIVICVFATLFRGSMSVCLLIFLVCVLFLLFFFLSLFFSSVLCLFPNNF